MAPSSELAPSAGEVQIWRVNLTAQRDKLHQYRGTLACDEAERADRFVFERDRIRFTITRGVLRSILGRYLRRDPACLRFRYTQYGKPELDLPRWDIPLRFNVSHSAHLALYAVTLGREVGVDVEEVRPGIAFEQIAAATFSATENAAIRRLPPHLRVTAFFNGWTRKEAYVKACGIGLALPLDRFEVSLVPGEPAALLSTPGQPAAVRTWSLRELTPGPGFVGAVAAEGCDWGLSCWQFEQ